MSGNHSINLTGFHSFWCERGHGTSFDGASKTIIILSKQFLRLVGRSDKNVPRKRAQKPK